MLHLKNACHMCWCVCYYKKTLKQFNNTFHTHPISLFKTAHNKEAQNEMKGSPHPRQPQCSHWNRNSKESDQPLKFRQDCRSLPPCGSSMSCHRTKQLISRDIFPPSYFFEFLHQRCEIRTSCNFAQSCSRSICIHVEYRNDVGSPRSNSFSSISKRLRFCCLHLFWSST